ncbi:MAG TPA: class I SAM-dependent methyltransferase, partial [Bacteroidia bacterium]|nr:class I SAM-dependent methyltransferase [Bacteroidia bacterium]
MVASQSTFDRNSSALSWEETIVKLRNSPDFKEIIYNSYLDEDLSSNIERFLVSEEFQATLVLIESFYPGKADLLDLGAGNGVSAISLALSGFKVTAVDPDPSETIGCGAIRKLAKEYNLSNINVVQSYGESLPFNSNSFDIVHVRQAMHHAADLNKFMLEISRVLKPGGYLFTIRDHVIYNEKDKIWFLRSHPLHRFYGGENAYKESEYSDAMRKSGLEVLKTIRYFDSVLNYAPLTAENLAELPQQFTRDLSTRAKQKFGILGNLAPVKYIYRKAV